MKKYLVLCLGICLAIFLAFSLASAASFCGPNGCHTTLGQSLSSSSKTIVLAQNNRRNTSSTRKKNSPERISQKESNDEEMTPEKCYTKKTRANGIIDIEFPDVLKGDYQKFIRRVGACKQAWLQDYEQNYKAGYKIGLVLGFKKSDPQEYRSRPLIRLIPR